MESVHELINARCLNNGYNAVILAGDMNMGSNEKYPSWDMTDVWKENGDAGNKITYDGSRYWGNTSKKRYDRMLYNGNLKCTKIELVGNTKIPEENIYPSDHDGIISTFVFD